MRQPTPLLAVLGATATGKTELAVALAEALGGEVLSCDASCVYRGLDLGTAKPGPELQRRVPHHLLDLFEPDEVCSAALWLERAERALAELTSKERFAVVVGGTGLYLRALLQGLAPSVPPDPELRRRLGARETARPGSLHLLLRRLDPPTASANAPTQVRRLVRALEHRCATGRRFSADRTQWSRAPMRPAIKCGLRLPRERRAERIVRRVDGMLASGLVDEVRALLEAGIDPRARSLQAIGYREIVAHLEGYLDLGEVRELMIHATRRYAKRQDSWFRKEPGVIWFEAAEHPSELPTLVERVMMTLPHALRSGLGDEGR